MYIIYIYIYAYYMICTIPLFKTNEKKNAQRLLYIIYSLSIGSYTSHAVQW